MLGSLKKALGGAVNKYSGQKDFLESVCAVSALVASADGDISDSEIEATVKAITSNASLSATFNGREIEKCANEMLQRASGGRMGRMGLYREIEDIAADADKAEAVLLAALDVAEGDGTIDPEEQKVLEKVASTLKLDLNKYLEV